MLSLFFLQSQLTLSVSYDRTVADGINLATIKLLGFPTNPFNISVNGEIIDTYVYEETTSILDLTVNVPLSDDLHVGLNYEMP